MHLDFIDPTIHSVDGTSCFQSSYNRIRFLFGGEIMKFMDQGGKLKMRDAYSIQEWKRVKDYVVQKHYEMLHKCLDM